MKEKIYTTYQISKTISVDITTVMSWIDQGKLNAYKTPGGHRRIPHTNLLQFLNQYKMPIPMEWQKTDQRVLIIDQDKNLQDNLKKLITGINTKLSVSAAGDAFEAGRQFESFRPDLIIINIHLPGVNCLELCKKIRQDGGLVVKVLAIADCANSAVKKEFLENGADAFIPKPIDAETISHAVSNLLSVNSAI